MENFLLKMCRGDEKVQVRIRDSLKSENQPDQSIIQMDTRINGESIQGNGVFNQIVSNNKMSVDSHECGSADDQGESELRSTPKQVKT